MCLTANGGKDGCRLSEEAAEKKWPVVQCKCYDPTGSGIRIVTLNPSGSHA